MHKILHLKNTFQIKIMNYLNVMGIIFSNDIKYLNSYNNFIRMKLKQILV